ncbi:MAG: O-sialoglycoprotein endopeptidase [Parcubacteria group bacterium Gr01-1014_30]|nr:MAG: O-sialoglycoprotein endopeptidase [Parcubacteria group bacterium Gr01-1014_30]
MRILGIETSCDETALALIEAKSGLKKPVFKILKEVVASQIEIHRPWGGVVPHLARREHEKNLPIIFRQVSNPTHIDLIAVTVGPGLDPCLWSGIEFAKEINKKLKTKLVGANHLEGHIYSFLLTQKEINFPAVQLVVSGGHTILVLMKSIRERKKIGETRDDAAGESFDKVARMLKLLYPGGPEIEKLAQKANAKAVGFPRPMLNSKNYDFSFSGLKTAVLYYLKENETAEKADVAASFQKAVVDVLVQKTMRASKEFGAKTIILSGGVAANKFLRRELAAASRKQKIKFISALPKYQTDNAVIIAVSAYINFLTGRKYKLTSQPDLGL